MNGMLLKSHAITVCHSNPLLQLLGPLSQSRLQSVRIRYYL